MITVFLHFADVGEADAAVRAALLAPGADGALRPGEPISMGYTAAGIRFDLAPVGGDGVLRAVVGTDPVEVDGLGTVEMPRLEARPGYHLNLLWHGEEDDLPDFGAARIHPETPSQIFAA